jgi:hypothetical protein
MQNYNTDSTKPLPKDNEELVTIPSRHQDTSLQLTESEKEAIRRRRWLESISDCV